MTPTHPGHGAAPVPPTKPFTTSSYALDRSGRTFLPGRAPIPAIFAARPSGRFDREMIRHSLMLRRERLAELEEQMVDSCDAAAKRNHHKTSTATPHDRRR